MSTLSYLTSIDYDMVKMMVGDQTMDVGSITMHLGNFIDVSKDIRMGMFPVKALWYSCTLVPY